MISRSLALFTIHEVLREASSSLHEPALPRLPYLLKYTKCGYQLTPPEAATISPDDEDEISDFISALLGLSRFGHACGVAHSKSILAAGDSNAKSPI